jgi:hypothetical protein
MGELQIAEEKRPQRVLFGDSWFASLSTCLALQKEFGIHFTGKLPLHFILAIVPTLILPPPLYYRSHKDGIWWFPARPDAVAAISNGTRRAYCIEAEWGKNMGCGLA